MIAGLSIRGDDPTMKCVSALLVVLALSGCDRIDQMRRESPAASVPAAPRMIQLESQIVQCELEPTGILGIGPGRRATVRVRNVGPVAGTFTVSVDGLYPGDGRITHGRSAITVPASGEASTAITFDAHDGMTTVRCSADAPMVAAPMGM